MQDGGTLQVAPPQKVSPEIYPDLKDGGGEQLCSAWEEKIACVRDYLIAATAKDCSIMIAFRRSRVPDDMSEAKALLLNYKVRIADLDYKALYKVQHHFDLDTEILHTANRAVLPVDVSPGGDPDDNLHSLES